MTENATFLSIIEYDVDGEQTQHELADAFAAIQVEHVASFPGYVSSRIVASTDGLRLYNLVSWVDEAAYLAFEETSDTAVRMVAIQGALDALGGHAASRMTGPPRYRLLRSVDPADLATGRAAARTGDA